MDDVTVWSGAKGLLGSAAVSVTDIHYDGKDTTAFYGKQVSLADVLAGKEHAPTEASTLKEALPS